MNSANLSSLAKNLDIFYFLIFASSIKVMKKIKKSINVNRLPFGRTSYLAFCIDGSILKLTGFCLKSLNLFKKDKQKTNAKIILKE